MPVTYEYDVKDDDNNQQKQGRHISLIPAVILP